MRRYNIPLDEPDENGMQNVRQVYLVGKTKKQRRKEWREYLSVELGTTDVHKMNRVTKALGFRELL